MSNVGTKGINVQCIEDFVNGDMRAFDKIYSFFSSKLRKFVLSIVKSESDAEDLVHEVFVKVWENRDRLRIKSQSSFSSYLFTISYNTTISFLRTKVKENQYVEFVNSIQIEPIDETLMDGLNNESTYERIILLVEQMPTKQREVFKLKYQQQLSIKEIAAKQGISENTVENHITRARRYLKDRLIGSDLAILLFLYLFH